MPKLFFDPSPHSPNQKIFHLIKPHSKILDIGCASGYLAQKLKTKHCRTYAIEINKALAKKAQKHCLKVINQDVETNKKLPFKKNFFDYLVYSDILEHLKNPQACLVKHKPLLNKNGYLIASIPNIARIEIRLKLLFGGFNYQPSGILSKDHLRFFTRASALQLLEKSGYRVKKTLYTGLGSRLKILPNLTAFQFIFIAQKK